MLAVEDEKRLWSWFGRLEVLTAYLNWLYEGMKRLGEYAVSRVRA